MIQLRFLGGAAVEEDGRTLGGAASHRHSLAFLALLACTASSALSREKLVGFLWPESPEKTARNRLGTLVHRLRRALGDDVVLSVGGDLRLNEALVEADVQQFQHALDAGRAADAVALYRGPFLDGFWLRDSADFERWAEGQRDRLRRAWYEALEALALEAREGDDLHEAARWWRERARADPLNSRVTLRLMGALAAGGNRAAALEAARSHSRLLAEELGADRQEEERRLLARLDAEQPAEPSGRRRADDAESSEPDPASVAVLPFDDLGEGQEEGRFFALGLHHDLLTRLTRLSGLTVISRASTLRFSGGEIDVSRIARELGVGTVVTGSLRQAGGRIRLNVQAIHGRTQAVRWAETYDGAFTDAEVFDIQSGLAERIVEGLKAELGPGERARVAHRAPGGMEASLLHAQGRAHLGRRVEQGVERSLEYFQRAIDKDPEYAPAWAGLGEALAIREWYGYDLEVGGAGGEGDRGLVGAMEAVRRAVELEPELGEAHAALGIVFAVRQEGPASVEALRRAVELQPGNADATSWLGWMQVVLGEPAAGLAPGRRAAELNPLAPYTRVFLALLYLALGRAREALEEAERARKLQPDYGIAHFMEGLALEGLGRLPEAAFALEQAAPLTTLHGGVLRTEVWAALAATRVRLGDAEEARRLLDRARSADDPFAVGLVHAALGDLDAAFAAFEEVARWGSFATPMLRFLLPEALDEVRKNERFGPLLARVDASWGLEGGEGSLEPASA